MTAKNLFLRTLLLIPFLSRAQVSIEIGPTGKVEIASTTTLEVSGDWTNDGIFLSGNGTVVLNGSAGMQIITSSSGETFYNLTISKSSDAVQLAQDISVNGVLLLSSGDLDLGGNVLSLGPDAVISETAGNTVVGTSGSVSVTKALNTPSALDVGGLGAILTSAADLGSTTVTRTHEIFVGGGNSSIARAFHIQPANNSGLNATLVFTYDDSELNGLDENELTLFRSPDSGASWSGVGGVLDKDNNTITLAGIDAFSLWTAAASSAPLPTPVESVAELLPTDFSLSQNYPNPFNPSTMIRYGLPERSNVRIEVHDMLGRLVAVLADQRQEARYYELFWNANVPTGIYFYRITAIAVAHPERVFVQIRKMVVVK